jgi:prepilin peptidase CpaA
MLATPPIELMVAALFFGLLVLAVVHDVGSLRIPNRISAAIVAIYPVHVATASLPVDWPGAVLVAVIVFAAGALAFAFGLFGGGDVKLLAAVALWVGPARSFEFLVLTALIGGVLALFMLSRWRLACASVADGVGAAGLRDALLRPFIPYGVAIALAGALSVHDPLLAPGIERLGG